MSIVGITGHRKISHSVDILKKCLKEILLKNDCKSLISGMSLGWDTIAAETAIKLNIPLIAAVPFEDQASLWTQEQQEYYLGLLGYAKEIYIPPIKAGSNKNAGYFARNRWIVDNCDILIAYIIDFKTGGTAHCFSYAEKQKKQIVKIIEHLPSQT
jgi:uncharacterized phage-like protein YoqJ